MGKKIITSDKFPILGPYSVAVETGSFIFISGQIPLNPVTGKLITNIKSATRQILVNMQILLQENGLKLDNIVKTTVFLKNMADFPAVNEVYAAFFPKGPPARSTIEVSALPKGAPIEIEAIAIRK